MTERLAFGADEELSALELHRSMLVVGCPSCNANLGTLRFYDLQTFSVLKSFEGFNDAVSPEGSRVRLGESFEIVTERSLPDDS